MQWKSLKRKRALIHGMITKQRVRNEEIKRKQTCSVGFVKVFEFQDNKFKIVQKNFLEIIKDSLENPLVMIIII